MNPKKETGPRDRLAHLLSVGIGILILILILSLLIVVFFSSSDRFDRAINVIAGLIALLIAAELKIMDHYFPGAVQCYAFKLVGSLVDSIRKAVSIVVDYISRNRFDL